MLEILQFYVSGFWVWLGITIGISVVGALVIKFLLGAILCIGAVVHNRPVNIE